VIRQEGLSYEITQHEGKESVI